MPRKPLYLSTGGCLPHPSRAVIRARDNPATVVGKSDRPIAALVLSEDANGFAVLDVPSTQGIATGGHDLTAVRSHRQARDPGTPSLSSVAFEEPRLSKSTAFPDHRLVTGELLHGQGVAQRPVQ